MKQLSIDALKFKVSKLKENKDFYNNTVFSDEQKKGYEQAINLAIDLFELQIEFEENILK